MVEGKDGSRQVSAKHVIVATGARARVFAGMHIDNEVVFTYRQALTPKTLPEELIIIGSGAIGVEFAYFYNAMGSKVTIIEAADQVLPLEDHDCARVMSRSFKKKGIKIITGAMVSAANNVDDRAVVEYQVRGEAQSIEGDACLVAVGVVGNTDNIGAEFTAMKVLFVLKPLPDNTRTSWITAMCRAAHIASRSLAPVARPKISAGKKVWTLKLAACPIPATARHWQWAKPKAWLKPYLMQHMFPHPTLSEMIHESALDSDARAIHL
jgi:pyruvate/2-oxoglutarate dehydrogenase complex dihydrolipoamide dehydrogenase (E3) component